MDRYMTVSEVRQRFLQLVNETVEGDQVIVTKRGKPTVVLIDFERLETLKRVAQLWQDPEALRGDERGPGGCRDGPGAETEAGSPGPGVARRG